MRTIARYLSGWDGIAAPPAPEYLFASGLGCPGAGFPGTGTKVDLASLLPGGVTHGAKAGLFRSLHARSPEPVNGFGTAKGIGS